MCWVTTGSREQENRKEMEWLGSLALGFAAGVLAADFKNAASAGVPSVVAVVLVVAAVVVAISQ